MLYLGTAIVSCLLKCSLVLLSHSCLLPVNALRPHLKDHGTVDISASGIELSISVNVTANRTDGHMQLNTTACSFSIGSLSVVFHGGARLCYSFLVCVLSPTILPCFSFHHHYSEERERERDRKSVV